MSADLLKLAASHAQRGDDCGALARAVLAAAPQPAQEPVACACPCCQQGIEAPHEYHLERRQMPDRTVQEPIGWLYDWIHSSATGRPDETYTGFAPDEQSARRSTHFNVRPVYASPQPQPAPESLRDHAVYAMAARAEITREQVEGLPRKLFDVASRIRAGESLHRDDEMVEQAAHAIKAALVLPAAPQPAPLTDADRKDAERYRRLRKGETLCWRPEFGGRALFASCSLKELDAAIDAALARAGGTHG